MLALQARSASAVLARFRPEVQVPVLSREGKQQGLAVQGEMTLAKQLTRTIYKTSNNVGPEQQLPTPHLASQTDTESSP